MLYNLVGMRCSLTRGSGQFGQNMLREFAYTTSLRLFFYNEKKSFFFLTISYMCYYYYYHYYGDCFVNYSLIQIFLAIC